MKILYISFGYEPFWSGGMVKNQLGLMKNLTIIGHDVTYFTAGRYNLKKKVYLREININGINAIEMVNSLNLYDPYCYCTDPTSHCSNSKIEKTTQKVIEYVKPDQIHISDLRMHSASVIELLKKNNLPVVKTIHNFWDLCPKGDLMFKDKSSCVDFDEGRNCLICLAKYKKQGIPLIHRIKGSINYACYYPLLTKIGGLKKFIPRRMKQTATVHRQYTAEAYLDRRRFFIKMLNKCDIVHTTSKNIARQLIGYGVNPHIIMTVPLSAEGLSDIKPKIDIVPQYPITFGYRGKLHSRKGIQVLLSAFSRLDQTKCKLVIYGDGDLNLLKPFTQKELNIEYRGRYRKNQINHVLQEIDIGVVPSIWEEIFGIVGLEYINARIPVIGSNIGGISEWLKDGVNGFLFNPGNRNELFTIMNRFLNDPTLIVHVQKKIKRWKTGKTYAQEISALYDSIKT